MLCPVDGATLVMTDRSGVEIDYCPQCRGVWLDRGELDKIIDRAMPAVPLAEPARPAPPPRQEWGDGDRRDPRANYGDKLREWRDRDDDDYRKRRKKSVLGELFDF